MEIGISWLDCKNIITSRSIYPQYQELSNQYILGLRISPLDYICIIEKNNLEELTDFETNYKSLSNKPIKQYVITEPANVSLTLYNAPDIVTVNPNETVSIDLKLQSASGESKQIIYGGALYADSPGFEDYVRFQIVDVDNIFGYGNNIVLKEYIKKAYLNNSNSFEQYDEAGAYLPVGLYLRCIYVSTKNEGLTKVKINYLLGVPD